MPLTSPSVVEALSNPMEWPMGWILCVKRYQKKGDWPECGILYDSPKTRNIVFLVNLYELKDKYPKVNDLVHGCPQYKYDSPKAMQEAGWVVD